MKQRLGIARALLSNAELIILDEPTNGLDPAGIAQLNHLIQDLNKNYGKTFLITSHHIAELVQLVHQVGIIKNGKLKQAEMKKNRFTIDELMEELRMKGVTDLSTVKYAILETNGQVSVLPYANQLPATAEQMNVTPDDVGLPLVIVNDGRVLDHNLRTRGLDHAWLDKQLKAHKLHNPRQVFLLTVDEQNRVYLVEKEALQ